jgi:hypothetical protein
MAARHAVIALLLLTGASAATPADPTAAGRAESVAAFERIVAVFRHPRCANCHTTTDFPRQGDDRHRHIMNVRRGPDGHGAAGLRCATCHQRTNQAASGVPGADEAWGLAPLSMSWGEQRLADSEICQRLLDRTRNGGRSSAQVLDHLGTNLVLWAWAPGLDRAGNIRSTPPVSYESFIRDAHRWVDTGTACPLR